MKFLTDVDSTLVEHCRVQAVALLKRNLSPAGILAATPSARAESRSYTAVFARDAAICALGMALSGDPALERQASTGIMTLAAHQAENGQIAKFVDVQRDEADFWYLGCIDATLWWLAAIALLDQLQGSALRKRLGVQVAQALTWLQCQEHPRFRLLQQNEASDWADIMPRSGFVLYSNALWYLIKKLYDLPHANATRRNANNLFHPFTNEIDEYRRARLLVHYARRNARNQDLYLSFVNFAFYGDEGDVFGNVLAILFGVADESAAHRIIRALEHAQVHAPYPVRVVCDPILEAGFLWRPYMSRHQQNFAWQYHNGGIWPFVGAFWVAALAATGLHEAAQRELVKVARANEVGNWAFNEWLHGQTLAPSGMDGQSWNAAAFLFAHRVVQSGGRWF